MSGSHVIAGLDRDRLIRLADGLVVALAVCLPWSTSATGILVVLWLVVLIPTLDVDMLRRELLTPAGGIPVLFWLLGLAGMMWADVSLAERLKGFESFQKLLTIPLLLAQFRRSGNGKRVAIGFLASCTVLLVTSYGHALLAERLLPTNPTRTPGVPVRDYILQSEEFQLCFFGIAYVVVEAWRTGRRDLAFALSALALAFVANIAYVTTGRTALVVMPILFVIFALRRFGWRHAVALVVAGAACAAVLWMSSPYLQSRVAGVAFELRIARTYDMETSSGLRLEFWRKSIQFIEEAPVIGHGTGSITKLFADAADPGTRVSSVWTSNPHQQILTVAIQLGLIGVGVLLAFWIAHLLLFDQPGIAAWCGLLVVAQNVIGSQFNSHLFDSGQAWMYVFGVGVMGGTMLHELGAGRPRPSVVGVAKSIG